MIRQTFFNRRIIKECFDVKTEGCRWTDVVMRWTENPPAITTTGSNNFERSDGVRVKKRLRFENNSRLSSGARSIDRSDAQRRSPRSRRFNRKQLEIVLIMCLTRPQRFFILRILRATMRASRVRATEAGTVLWRDLVR